jgi:DNA-binding CsgD family transcriptional regulator/tetratricopeptide (TPR) repeat protein
MSSTYFGLQQVGRGDDLGGAALTAVLLERSEQAETLISALTAVLNSSQGRTVLVRGEAGIGKTALLNDFCTGLNSSARVLRAACDPLFTPQPLGPLFDLAASAGGELATSVHGGARPHDVAHALLRHLRSDGRSVLVIDDAHWADEATLDVIRLLGRRIVNVPALMVLSYRDEQLDRSHPLQVVLGDLPGGGQVTRITLGGLSHTAVATLAQPHGIDGAELHERTAGNPFFVTEVLAAGAERIPHTVRDAVLARAARLSPPARDLMDAASIVPRRAEKWLLEALVPDALAAGLDDCLGSGVLSAADGWVAFRHEIARLVVEESLPPGKRSALHRAALAALAAHKNGAPDLARLVHHAEAAGDVSALLRFASAAAEHALAAGGRREAANLYARALRFADRIEPVSRARLLERFAEMSYFTGRGEKATAALREALAIYRADGNLLGQGRTLRELGKQIGHDGDLLESLAASTAAVAILEQLPPGAELARTYASLSANYALSDEAEAIRLGAKAIALAEQTGCADALIYALNNVGAIQLRRGDPEGLAKLERSRELAEQTSDEAGVGRAYLHLALVLVTRRELVLADRYLERAIQYCREHGFEAWLTWLTLLRAESDLARGRWADAEKSTTAILCDLPPRFNHARCSALVLLGRLRARRGQPGYWPLLDEARDMVKPVNSAQTHYMIAGARAEAAWLEAATATRIAEETEQAVALEKSSVLWFAGELSCWQWRVGLIADDTQMPGALADPYLLEASGDALAAARWWQDRECGYDAALALASSDDPVLLRRALDDFRRLGAGPAGTIVARKLRSLGERGLPRGPRPATAANPAGLTQRELDVLSLLAAGMRNAEIADRLVVSARTVDHHVSAILRKLGARSRGAAVLTAVRLGLAEAQ